MSALPVWSTACPDWERRIVAGESLIPFPPLFPEQSKIAMGVFESLRMVDAPPGDDGLPPLLGEITLPWAMDFVSHIFGAYEQETGIRHITEFFLLISKKNAKSTNAAAIMMIALLLCWRNSGEFIVLSPTIEIAGNSFKPAADMVRADEELAELLQVQDHVRTITHRTSGVTLKVVAADSNTVSGKKAIGVLVDELWLFGKMPNAENMLREATGGLASRPEGFIIYLTTQSDEPPAGVFKQKLEYARKVRDGEVVDNRFLPVLYEFPKSYIEQELHLLPENFYITNPNLDKSVTLAYLERELMKARETSEESVKGFLSKHLNIEIGMNLRGDRWAGADFWEKGTDLESVTLDRLIEECEVVTVGIDGGGLDDLLGASAVGRTKKEHAITIPEHYDKEIGAMVPARTVMRKKWLVWAHAWAHPSVLERRKAIATKIRDLAKAEELTIVELIGQDTDQLADIVHRLHQAGVLYQCGLDPACIGGILDAILLTGVPEDKMVTVNQGWRLAGSIKTAERKLAEGVLVHGGTALMKWCVGNAKCKVSGNAIVITKQVSGTAKIDPLIAMFNAVSLMALNPPAQTQTYNFSNIVIGG